MCIRAIDYQAGLKPDSGVDRCVLNAINSLHRDTSCDRRSLRGNEIRILCWEKSTILRFS